VSKSFRTESITKYTLITTNTCWEATQRVMVAKLTRLTNKIAIQLHLVAESCTICSSRSMRPVRKLLDTPSRARVRERDLSLLCRFSFPFFLNYTRRIVYGDDIWNTFLSFLKWHFEGIIYRCKISNFWFPSFGHHGWTVVLLMKLIIFSPFPQLPCDIDLGIIIRSY
jgi:hypothetical protein